MSSLDYDLIPYYTLSPDKIVAYKLPSKRFVSNSIQDGYNNLLDNSNRYNELSHHSRKRLLRAISYMDYISSDSYILGRKFYSKELDDEIRSDTGAVYSQPAVYRLTFVTLTLSSAQHNTDEQIKRDLLNQFLVELRKQYSVSLYVWKAEKQNNGNIHFHIILNVYIHWRAIRNMWNRIQNKPGYNYVDEYSSNMRSRYSNGFFLDKKDKRNADVQRKAYQRGVRSGWGDPNSTDIHSLRKVDNIGAYLGKYLAKNVTKTDRIIELDRLYADKQRVTSLSDALLDDYYSTPVSARDVDAFKHQFNMYNDNIDALDFSIDKLLVGGVSGRIWGQSSVLSKITNYSDSLPEHLIPDIEIVLRNKKYISVLNVGQSDVVSIGFPLSSTPHLKRLLDEHIDQYLT